MSEAGTPSMSATGGDAARLDPLLPGLRGCEPEAFADLYDVMAGQLLAFAHGLVADRPTAEDVVQDVFVRFARHARRFRGDGRALLSWLYTTTRRRCVDMHRKRDRSREQLTGTVAELADARAAADGQAAEDGNSDVELDPAVEAALAQLTEAQRAAIVLRRVHGFDGGEVGELLGLDREAVYALCARGERRLRTLLAEPSDTHDRERP